MIHLHRYVIVASLPPPWREQLDKMRRAHDRWTRSWLPPHITIIPPFETDLPVSSIRAAQQIAVTIPFAWQGWGSYRRPDHNIIWLNPGQDEVPQARQILLERLPMLQPYQENPRYAPPGGRRVHVTIVSRVPDAEFDSLYNQLSAQPISGSGVIEGLQAYGWDREMRRWLEVY